MSKLSHQEAAWINTPANSLIDFELMFEGRPDAVMTLKLLKEEHERDETSPLQAHSTGSKRPGWKKEFMAALTQVAGEIGDISEEDIQREVIAYRKAKRKN